MKAKLIDERVIRMDYPRWNDELTAFGLASEFEEGYMEYVPAEPPVAGPGQRISMRYEVRDGAIYQVWEVEEVQELNTGANGNT